ncbi:MAG: Txe/YoeB family addiction module toxin [Bacteroidales bacterium]|nr:Txe/YoeB family addiction module toxin [Bacteroidales bacterium]
MELKFKPTAETDLQFWYETSNQKILKRIEELLKSTIETPFSGIGKPEPLRHNLSGYWSRRIDQENRMVYKVEVDTITIHSLKGHYL